ncbi:LOB domain-containing protein 11-like [Vitis riparia]|uniref:LOB domain-containing protein 11-like n=1 Tax=Vitis riparia TaxID=96939 RepID=UPI00155A8CF6|nr:LOB domain-containing protein 11-like [Vitis riparia]
MEYADIDKTTRPLAVSCIPFSSSSPSSSRFSPPPTAFQGPCAACKVLRRRCDESCILAPYFPPNEPLKLINAHKVFGASNIAKALQELPQSTRADAVSSMVYEANARIRDPVYGCAGTICHLHKHLDDLKAELAMAQAELCIMQCQQQQQNANTSFFLDTNLISDYC